MTFIIFEDHSPRNFNRSFTFTWRTSDIWMPPKHLIMISQTHCFSSFFISICFQINLQVKSISSGSARTCLALRVEKKKVERFRSLWGDFPPGTKDAEGGILEWGCVTYVDDHQLNVWDSWDESGRWKDEISRGKSFFFWFYLSSKNVRRGLMSSLASVRRFKPSIRDYS